MLPARALPEEGISARGYFQTEIRRQREVWERKAALRRMYQQWFARVERLLPKEGPVVELGCGAGGFKQWRPGVIATDLAPSPWTDLATDAGALPFPEGALGAVVAFDVLHHVARPVPVLREIARVLRPQGLLIFLEPAITLWSRLVWRWFHHEPVDLDYDPFQPLSLPPNAYFANTALPFLLLERHRARLEREVPELRLTRLDYSDCLVYPLTGGFSGFQLLPGFAVAPLYRLECAALAGLARRLTGMRMLAVLERVGGRRSPRDAP